MGISRKLRNIALSQINALKDRLDRVDEETEAEVMARRADREARRELDEFYDPPSTGLRTPEQIVAGAGRVSRPVQERVEPHAPAAPYVQASSLTRHFKVLGLADGAELAEVEAAYVALVARCDPERFPEGTTERQSATEIRTRVESSFSALKDALDPTVGRFDKLEL